MIGRLFCMAGVAATLVATPALAQRKSAPPPAKPVPQSFFSGEWYEIAHTRNSMQGDCQAATTRFLQQTQGKYSVVQTCRKGSPNGPMQRFNSRGAILPGTENAKFTMTFLGGLKTQEYWILDRAEDSRWAIISTPGGNFVWLMSRSPDLNERERQSLLNRIRQLGYDTAKLVFPRH
jgi:apolipoprotein D and lipocalin family protein